MKAAWHEPRTKAQCTQYDQTCAEIYVHFGSYPKIAAALGEETNEYIAAQTVRIWFRNRKIPTPHAFLLADMVGTDPFPLAPWLRPYLIEYLKTENKNG